MAKGKSSATSATRKKHAKKAVGNVEEPAVPKEKKPKGKDKKNKEPRKKVYIPPVKPAPVQPDPLDTLGLAQTLPPELLVVLRRLAKKDAITKRRALEDFQAGWVEKARFDGDDSQILHVIVETVPVWLHHVPALFLHPSRRIRLLAVGLHSSLLRLPSAVRDQLVFFIREVSSADQAQYILGAWCMAAHDVDRQVSSLARESWNGFVSLSEAPEKKLVLNESLLTSLWEFIQNTLLDPMGIYLYVNPPQPAAPPPVPHKKGGRPVTMPKKDDDASIRSRAEEDEEHVQDRNARLRVGAFGSAEWVLNSHADTKSTSIPEEFPALFSNPVLWSALYPLQTPPFVIEAAGFNQPSVRRAAWSFLQTLLRTCKDHLKTLLPVLSSAVLRSAWIESDQNVRGSMWQPLLTFLKEFPNSWEIEGVSEKEEDEVEESESEGSEDKASKPVETPRTVPNIGPSKAYQEFLQFLELGCAGMPLQGYPAVLLILSVIPSSILASTSPPCPLDDLFTSFWAAVDGRALSSLDKAAASAAFLSSLLESLLLLVRRLRNGPPEEAVLLATGRRDEDPAATADVTFKLVSEQFAKVWDELSSRRLKVEGAPAATLLARTLSSLNQLDLELFPAAWDALSSGIKSQFKSIDNVISPLVSTVLGVFLKQFDQGSALNAASKALTADVVQATVEQCDQMLTSTGIPSAERVSSLVGILGTFGESLFGDVQLTEGIDETVQQHTYRLLSVAPSLLFVYLIHRKDEELCLALWQSVLLVIASHPDETEKTLPPLLDAAEKGLLPEYLMQAVGELDDLAGTLLAEALTGRPGSAQLLLVQRLLPVSHFFISQSCTQGLIASVGSAFTLHFQSALHDASVSLDALDVPLDLINVLAETERLLSTDVSTSLMPDVFLFAYLSSHFSSVEIRRQDQTRLLWNVWLSKASEDAKENTFLVIRQRLHELVVDCSARPAPEHILQMLAEGCPGLVVDVTHDIFPSRHELDVTLNRLPSTPADPSLAVLDPLVPPPSQYEYKQTPCKASDHFGYSEYARIVSGFLLHLLEDRQAAKQNVWALRHFLALSIYADDLVKIPAAQSPAFAEHFSKTTLQDLISRVQQITAYLLSSVQEEGWHTSVVNAVTAGAAVASTGGVGTLITDLIAHAKGDDTVRESRILYTILQHVLNNCEKAEADRWISLARKLEKQAPQTSLAIALAVTRFAPEPPLLDRYRNEVAAAVLGVHPSKANTDGLWLLRRLTVTAPDPESEVAFLPQPRAVNFMKACQQWITSDDDLDEEVASEMTSVFFHLAPILQNVPGALWDLIFDVMENNLENSSFNESSTLVTLSRSLRLFIMIQNLASTNKSLRAMWDNRRTSCLTLIRDLVATKPDEDSASAPLSICSDLALQVIQDLPVSLMDETTLPKFCHILTDASLDVQRMGYQLLHEAARKYTEHMVIEAAVDSESTLKSVLPSELVDILQRNLNYEDPIEHDDWELSGYLLAWMIVFDLFENASLKVKSGYMDQLRDLDLVPSHFLPNILNILGLYGGILRSFKLDPWAIDEYYLDFYSTDSPLSLRLLAAHVYYRALLVISPLIRNWLLGCRDRRLSSAVTTYTSNHFSPVTIRTQMSQIKDPDALADLTDENFTVKIANAVNEVTAAYKVDEQQLEITLKLPSDYPLHDIEIKNTKCIGVPDERWRAWVLGIRHVLSFRGGSIVDGFNLFKKNLTFYFGGLAECAICYSVISAMDGSLPRSPCQTCKNAFHAGCLYQWFDTSHSHSCPLCRSEMV